MTRQDRNNIFLCSGMVMASRENACFQQKSCGTRVRQRFSFGQLVALFVFSKLDSLKLFFVSKQTWVTISSVTFMTILISVLILIIVHTLLPEASNFQNEIPPFEAGG